MKLIGVAGFARSGKDTIADYLVREHGFARVAFADPMRDMLYAINPIVKDSIDNKEGYVRVQELVDNVGWDVAKVEYPEIRALLQRLGTEAGRKVLGDTIWTDTLLAKAEAIGGNVVVSDVRFPDECDAIHRTVKGTSTYAGRVIRVNRPRVTSVNNHITDRKLPDDCIDYEVENDGTIEELQEKIRIMFRLPVKQY